MHYKCTVSSIFQSQQTKVEPNSWYSVFRLSIQFDNIESNQKQIESIIKEHLLVKLTIKGCKLLLVNDTFNCLYLLPFSAEKMNYSELLYIQLFSNNKYWKQNF